MSLSENERSIIVRRELEKSESTFDKIKTYIAKER